MTPWRTASVVAASAELANAASTAAIVMGDAAPTGCVTTACRRVSWRTTATVTRLGGWPEPDESVASPAPSSDRKVLDATLGA